MPPKNTALIEMPKTIHDWVAVAGVIVLVLTMFIAMSMKEALADHDKDEQSHPTIWKSISDNAHTVESVQVTVEHNRKVADLIQSNNAKEHGAILALLKEIRTNQRTVQR